MKLTIVGGGGFRVPLVYGALLGPRDRLAFDEIVLHDVDAGRLERMGGVLHGLAAEHGEALPFRVTTDLGDAVEGADFVFCAIRVGGLEGRVVDEAGPALAGVLGQETTGPGGICFALRTIPAMVELAETIAERAPGAWLINFTNPAGMVTEAVQQVLGDRVIGICDTPSSLCRRVARALGRAPEEMWFDYFGLNHLGWLQAAARRRRRPAARAARRRRALAGFEEGRLFGGDWLRTLGMIPNEYLYYFYFGADTVSTIRGRAAARRLPARVAGRVLRAERPGPRRRAGRLARDPRRARPHLHGGRAAPRPASRPTTTTAARRAATRARRWRWSRRSPTTPARS